MSNSEDELNMNLNDSSENISTEILNSASNEFISPEMLNSASNEHKSKSYDKLSYESKSLNSDKVNISNDNLELHSGDLDSNSLDNKSNENSFSKKINLELKSSKSNILESKSNNISLNEGNIKNSNLNIENSNIENSDSNSNVENDQFENFILTMKVRLDKNNMNEIVVPDNVSVDKLLKVSRNKYLNEIESLKKQELESLKKEIHELNNSKFESIFKNLMQSYNSDFDKKIESIFNKDIQPFNKYNKSSDKNTSERNINLSDSKSNQDKNLDSDPFVMDYQMINKKVSDSKTDSSSSQRKKVVKSKPQKKKTNEFKEYFDCIYIINLPDERDKITEITTIFNANRIKYKVVDGVNAKSDRKYMKYYQRWLYQKNLDDKFMNKFIFDEKLYLNKNPDLVGLNNKSKCWNHWMKEGKKSNRNLYDKSNILLESQLGNLIAHMNVIKDAKYESYNNILILEDDVFIHNNYNQLHLDLINKINNNYNLLYYGGIQKKWNGINIENNFYKANNTHGGFAYAIKSNIFEELINRMNELVDPLDKLLIKLQKILKACYVSYPNIFITDLENGKIHRKRALNKYSKHFKWKLDNYKM